MNDSNVWYTSLCTKETDTEYFFGHKVLFNNYTLFKIFNNMLLNPV